MRRHRMIRLILMLLAAVWLSATAAAHGPQIQITNDDGRIVTRRLIVEQPYSTSLTSETSVYVMPLREFNGVWYSRPNSTIDPILGTPLYFSGPGLAYGYDQVDGGVRTFAADSVLSIALADGLKRWNGSVFDDAGATQLKVFRGSNVDIASPPESFAVTSDSGPFDSLSLAPISASYNDEAHSTIRYALLGDGTSPTSTGPDGVYLLSMQLSSSQPGLAPSDEYFFVLHKNAAFNEVAGAVSSLGVDAALVQYVPEPQAVALVAIAAVGLVAVTRALQLRGER